MGCVAQRHLHPIDALQDGVDVARVGAMLGDHAQAQGLLIQSPRQRVGLAPGISGGGGHEAGAEPSVQPEHGRHVVRVTAGFDHQLLDLRQTLRTVLSQKVTRLACTVGQRHGLTVAGPVCFGVAASVTQQGADGLCL